MSGLGPLLVLQLRVGWLRQLVTVALVVGLGAAMASSLEELYGEPAAHQTYQATAANTPVFNFFNGRPHDLASMGGVFAFEMGLMVLLIVPVLAIQRAVALTRQLEDTGRLDLITAGRVHRLAPLTVAALLVVADSLLLGGATALGGWLGGLDGTGMAWYGSGLAAFHLVFATLGLLTAQLAGQARGAMVLGLGVMAATYLIRGWLDVDDRAARVLPQQWLVELRPFADEPRTGMLAALIGCALVLAVLAGIFAARRDLGAGLLRPRPGPAAAGSWLAGVAGLQWTLVRGAVLAWLVGMTAWASLSGLLTEAVEDLAVDNPALQQVMGESMDATLAMLAVLNALLATAAGVQVAGVLVAEERLGRLGRVLSGWTPRWHWSLGVLLVSGGLALLALALAGLVCGLGMAAGLDESDWIGEAVRAHLVHAAPVVLVAWLAAALGSWRPALQPIAWAVVAWGLVAAVLGDVLDLPEWGLDRSPWRWVGEVPVDAWQRGPTALAGLGALAVAGLGALVFTRRDLLAG